MALGDKSVYSPLTTLKNLFRKPVTIKYPKQILRVFPKEGVSPIYRGLHTNDLEKCVGCGACKRICPFDAIKMKVIGKNEQGRDIKKPVVDYGRCSFCAFCVDVCPTNSLKMSRHYIYKIKTVMSMSAKEEVEYVKEKFKIMPDEKLGDDIGYNTGKVKKVLG
ncbi:4Fe-4S binding protein [Caloramator proteoclasticus]|uniref:NADH-quinone oxidoreductase subunit I n=1 Tax=Caloramator proteoclasticus DSM 10124 TaxID=1121262 RepID=A0A1M4TTL5_9CLOT|nr:4Fe-4S binding protein [Caloramator proteoclasticus]SHE47792.1 NADH-quinone oxidoreductase subunit I [Caloramator proteoclasticus DSM 10124]